MLSITNEDSLELNKRVLACSPREETVCRVVDSVASQELSDHPAYLEEF
jgi:hypothetical protein